MATRFFPRYKANLITSRFGQRTHPTTGEKNKMHNGIDMTATNDGKTGQTDYITAHTGGTVEAVGYTSVVGYYVNIRVDSKTVMVYRHLKNNSTLKKGEKVKTGDRLGYMGATGNASGAHLHFGIQYNGKWIDPEPYLDKDWVQPVKMVQISVPVLKNGDSGDAVKAMQILLSSRGYKGEMKESAYGSFGSKTEKSLREYQEAHGLTVDGSCGPATWSKLLGVNKIE